MGIYNLKIINIFIKYLEFNKYFDINLIYLYEAAMGKINWQELCKLSRLRLLRMHYESRVGHIGGNLSCLDLMLALHHGLMEPQDQFVLSKGHSAGAYYITLWTLGKISDDELTSFHKDNTHLSGHPPTSGLPDILFATGSLGHGNSLAAGLALAKCLKKESGRVFCLTSDGEWDEGSTWEALLFACHRRLSNLTIVVDRNGLQGFGTTEEVAALGDLAAKFRTFDVEVMEVNGHDPASVVEALSRPAVRPTILVASTTKGQGVSFMEGRMEWHYLPMSTEQYIAAINEIEKTCAMPSAGR